jgi:hypothetical protein
VEILLKWGIYEGHFTQEAEAVFRHYVASQCSGVTQISQMALPTRAPQPVQVWLKSENNEGHFTLEAGTVFRSYLASHCSAENQISHMALHSQFPQ